MIAWARRKYQGTDSHTKEVLAGTVVAFFLRGLGTGLGFLLNVAVARLLGAEGAGLYFLALSVTVIGSVIGRVGLDNALLRFVATHATHGEWNHVKGVHALGMRLAIAVSSALALIGFVTAGWMAAFLFNKPELAEPLRWMSLSILPFAMLNLQAESLKGLKRIRDAMLLQSIGVPLIALLLIWPLANMAGVEGASWGYLSATTLVALLGLWAWRNASTGASGDASNYSFSALWVSARPLFVISLMNTSLTWLPLLLLGIWVSASEVGVFGAATRLALLVSFLLITLNNVLAPKFAEFHAKGDLQAMGQLARRSAAMITLLVSPLFAVLFIFNEEAMSLFGPEFTAGATVLAILLGGQLVNVITGSVSFLLMMSGNEKTMKNIIIMSALLQLILVLILAPLIGSIGAAIASTLVLSAKNLVAVFAVYKKLGVLTLPTTKFFMRKRKRNLKSHYFK